MKKIVLEYDENTGTIKDAAGCCVGSWIGLVPFDEADKQSTVRDLIKLKDAGFTAEDIVTLKEGKAL